MSNRYPGHERDTPVFIEVMRYHGRSAVPRPVLTLMANTRALIGKVIRLTKAAAA